MKHEKANRTDKEGIWWYWNKNIITIFKTDKKSGRTQNNRPTWYSKNSKLIENLKSRFARLTLNSSVLARNGGESYIEARYGEGSGQVILDDVICTGNESSLAECSHRQPFTSNCEHDEDVSVRCFLPNTSTTFGKSANTGYETMWIMLFYNFTLTQHFIR